MEQHREVKNAKELRDFIKNRKKAFWINFGYSDAVKCECGFLILYCYYGIRNESDDIYKLTIDYIKSDDDESDNLFSMSTSNLDELLDEFDNTFRKSEIRDEKLKQLGL